MTVGKGLKVNLFASEKEFPDLANPVQMAFDTKGRLWVAVWPTYPHWKPKEEMNDKILILEDTDGDGKADKQTVFADDLHCPTGFEFCNGGVLVAQAPDLMFLKDTDGDDKADVRERVLSGLDSADTHHTSNSFALDPGRGRLLPGRDVPPHAGRDALRPARAAAPTRASSATSRGRRSSRSTSPTASPTRTATSSTAGARTSSPTAPAQRPLLRHARSPGHLDYPAQARRAAAGLPAAHPALPGHRDPLQPALPRRLAGQLLVANVIGFQGILRYKIERRRGRASPARELEPIVSSTDPNFRPSDIEVGPDGAIYFLDWQNPIIGHMQHNLRDPSRDRDPRPRLPGHLRGPAAAQARRRSPASRSSELLDLLKEPEDRVRYRAKIELGAPRHRRGDRRRRRRGSPASTRTTRTTSTTCSKRSGSTSTTTWSNVELLERLLASPDFRARAAATRVLCYWRDRVPDALELLKTLAADAVSPGPPRGRPRRQLLHRARGRRGPPDLGRAPIRLLPRLHPRRDDAGARAVREEGARRGPADRRSPATPAPGSSSATSSTDDLLKMKRNRGVLQEILFRKGVRDEVRRAGARRPGHGSTSKREPTVLIDALARPRRQRGRPGRERRVRPGPAARPTAARAELAAVRGRPRAAGDRRPSCRSIRQLGYVALIAADGSVDQAWALAVRSVPVAPRLARRDAPDPRPEPAGQPLSQGRAAAPRPARRRWPAVEHGQGRRTAATSGSSCRATADARRWPRSRSSATAATSPAQGKASQKNTANGGDAAQGHRRQHERHLRRRRPDPHRGEHRRTPGGRSTWAPRCPIDVDRRLQPDRGRPRQAAQRLHPHGPRRRPQRRLREARATRAPSARSAFEVGGGDPEGVVRRAAMNALTTIRGQESPTFKALAQFVRDGRRPPRGDPGAPADPRRPTGPTTRPSRCSTSLIAYVRQIPAADRDSARGARRAATRRRPRRAAARRPGRGRPQGAGRAGRARDPRRHRARADALRQGADRRPGRQAGRDPLREQRHDAAQLRGRPSPARSRRSACSPRRRPPSPTPSSGSTCRPRTRSCWPAACSSRARSQKLSFTAPTQAGVYPYVCTYPGHWRRMYGASTSSTTSTSTSPTPRRTWPRTRCRSPTSCSSSTARARNGRSTTWPPSIAQLEHRPVVRQRQADLPGRHLRRLPQARTASATSSAPTSTKLDPKQTPADMLRNILEPSAKINEKYPVLPLRARSARSSPA